MEDQPPEAADNIRRPPAITDADEFLPVPDHFCIFGPIDKPDPWYRRLADWVKGWFRQR